MGDIQMVDVKSQYLKIKDEIQAGIEEVINSTAFINGPKVKDFTAHLSSFLNQAQVVPCANGTDALQIAMMALDLKPGDEVIVPAFTYVATAEVIGLLGLTPVMVDVDPNTFNCTAELIEKAITPKTKAIVPVHLFGQSADMDPIVQLARKNGIYVIEDNAQALGAVYHGENGPQKTGTIGHIGCTSFYPSKNLGAFGDGGALCTTDEQLAERIHKIANHGQEKRYYHEMIGCNSRLDAIQAAILDVKLKYLDEYAEARNQAAQYYDHHLQNIEGIQIPVRSPKSTHVFHQYTLKVAHGKRDELQQYLQSKGIPTMIYYPVPLYHQKAFKKYIADPNFKLPVTESLCQMVISLPMHTELDEATLNYITLTIKEFFNS
jgi:dTDP-4-amino-4,6-dideoxygalactose transaminase